MQTATAVGFYGKLPCNGDFLQRRVPQEFIDVWDPWLQECIHASREALREDWLNAYLTSPVWRFVLAEGVCGSGAYAGVMLPSVDRVGRYFPLTIVAQLNVDDGVLEIGHRDQITRHIGRVLAIFKRRRADKNPMDIMGHGSFIFHRAHQSRGGNHRSFAVTLKFATQLQRRAARRDPLVLGFVESHWLPGLKSEHEQG